MSTRYALGIEYDGAGFLGWQRQREGRTVQASLEKALTTVADHEVHVVCAGRTDTGVHATGQVVHFDSHANRTGGNWLRGSNANLPPDVSVQWVIPASGDFHARFSAVRRHYRYIIYTHQARPALLRQQVCWQTRELDATRMQQAADQLLGEHDFTSFRAAACQAHSPVRTIYTLDVQQDGAFTYIDVVANAFLHHMVRCIAGVLIAVGCGDQRVDWAGQVLAARDRKVSGINAPPGGLYLVNVTYPGEFQVPSTGRLPVFS